jgi:hypothetical protein
MSRDTFTKAVLEGRAKPEDIDNWVAHWHDSSDVILPGPLSDHLGMTEDECAQWVMHPEKLKDIIESHRVGHNEGEINGNK